MGLIHPNNQLLLVLVSPKRSHNHIRMIVLPDRLFHVLKRDGIPPIPAHVFGGSLEDQASLDFDEGLEGREVFLLDELV